VDVDIESRVAVPLVVGRSFAQFGRELEGVMMLREPCAVDCTCLLSWSMAIGCLGGLRSPGLGDLWLSVVRHGVSAGCQLASGSFCMDYKLNAVESAGLDCEYQREVTDQDADVVETMP